MKCRSSHTASEQGSRGRVLGHRVTGLGALLGHGALWQRRGCLVWVGGCVNWVLLFFLIVFSFEISVCCIEVWLTAGLGNTALSLRDGRVPEKHQELRNVPNTSLESRFCTSLGTVGSDGKGTKQNQVLGAHPFSPCWKERDQEAEQGGGSRGISLGANPSGLPISSL